MTALVFLGDLCIEMTVAKETIVWGGSDKL
jgi:hypothetical protein